MKNCPICGKQKWDYDVVSWSDTFCGDCYHDVRQEWYKLEGATKVIYGEMKRETYYIGIANVIKNRQEVTA